MKPIIVGTAGHIDHGKTALVKALTGIDADRLEEEKRRGITIDIGFAHLELPAESREHGSETRASQTHPTQSSSAPHSRQASPTRPQPQTLRLGFVDVPGHERFVRNMLAGVGGIDLVLLVVAADEAIKPQTVEHFQICRLLNIPRGITVLTKSDLVDTETLEVVRLEVEEFLRGSFLEGAPMVAVSARTGAGLEELKRELARVAAQASTRDASAIARLPIDRVFSMKGFGTVVTGTLVAGSIRKEQELEIFPAGKQARVRGVQVHGSSADKAVAGERTALNLAGAEVAELARGMTLAEPGLLRSTRRADVALTLLSGGKPLKDRARVHFHCYTTETIAEVALIGGSGTAAKQMAAGSTAYAQLRFAEPVLLLPGDRFIVRQFSPVVTIGGGVVLDAAPLSGKVAAEKRASFLETLQHAQPQMLLLARVARRGMHGMRVAELVAETGWRLAEIQERCAGTIERGEMVRVGREVPAEGGRGTTGRGTGAWSGNDLLISGGAFLQAMAEMLNAVAAFHKANPLVRGMGKEELRERLGLAPEMFSAVLEAQVREKKLESGAEQVWQAGRGVVMKDEEAESKKMIEDAFATAGLKVPALNEVLAGVKVDRARAQKIVTLLLRERVLVKLGDELVFHRSALESLRGKLQEYKKTAARIDVAKFKDLTGVSRKYAIPLLEWLDRERVTRRVGDAREIL